MCREKRKAGEEHSLVSNALHRQRHLSLSLSLLRTRTHAHALSLSLPPTLSLSLSATAAAAAAAEQSAPSASPHSASEARGGRTGSTPPTVPDFTSGGGRDATVITPSFIFLFFSSAFTAPPRHQFPPPTTLFITSIWEPYQDKPSHLSTVLNFPLLFIFEQAGFACLFFFCPPLQARKQQELGFAITG